MIFSASPTLDTARDRPQNASWVIKHTGVQDHPDGFSCETWTLLLFDASECCVKASTSRYASGQACYGLRPSYMCKQALFLGWLFIDMFFRRMAGWLPMATDRLMSLRTVRLLASDAPHHPSTRWRSPRNTLELGKCSERISAYAEPDKCSGASLARKTLAKA